MDLDGVDEKIILMKDLGYSRAPDSGIGGGGSRAFTFRTQSAGKAKVHLSLKREWEKTVNSNDQFVVFIEIR